MRRNFRCGGHQGEINEGQVILSRLDAVAAMTGTIIKTATADAGFRIAPPTIGSSTTPPGSAARSR